VHIKCNLAAKGESVGFKIDKGKFFWTGKSQLNAQDILREESSGRFKIDEAIEFLRLTLNEGPVLAKEVFKDAEEHGISAPTIKRAKKVLNVKSAKDKFDGKWRWELPRRGSSDLSGIQEDALF